MKTQHNISKKMTASLVALILTGCLFTRGQAQNPCQAGFSFTVNTNTVTFTNTSTGGSQPVFSWNFGDGSIWSANPAHTYLYSGTYMVCLSMYDDSLNGGGCQSTYCDSVVITNAPNPPCNAYFTYYVDSFQQGGVYFQDQSAGAQVSWSWSFPGGNPSTSAQQNPVVWYNTPGWHPACLTIVTASGDTCSFCDSIAYFPCSITAGFTVNASADPAISFTNTSTGAGSPSYYWNFGDGGTGWTANPTHTYQYNGSYIVCLTVYDSVNMNSCYDVFCDTITISNAASLPCNAQFYAYDSLQNIPTGMIYFYDYSTGNPNSWFWNFGDGNTSTQQHPTHQYALPGTYWVCLTITTPGPSTCTTCDSVQYKVGGAGVGEEPNAISDVQNYPNPFQQHTVISYTLEKNSAVQISVFDRLGSRVAVLENADKNAGRHELGWNAASLPAGIYHLELKCGTGVTGRKLVLIR